MPATQERSSRFPEVAHFVSVAQHLLKLDGICLNLPVGQTVSVGDAVSHTSNFYTLPGSGNQTHQ